MWFLKERRMLRSHRLSKSKHHNNISNRHKRHAVLQINNHARAKLCKLNIPDRSKAEFLFDYFLGLLERLLCAGKVTLERLLRRSGGPTFEQSIKCSVRRMICNPSVI